MKDELIGAKGIVNINANMGKVIPLQCQVISGPLRGPQKCLY